MTGSNLFPDRGDVGPTPAMTTRADESFLDYIKDVRSALMMGKSKAVHAKANDAILKAGITVEPTAQSIDAVRAVIQTQVPEAGVWARVYRSTQDAFWKRVVDSYGLKKEHFLRMLDEYDQRGPGSVTWNPDFDYPEYAKVRTHQQLGGYFEHPLAGLHYDYGGRVFLGKAGDNDSLHQALSDKISIPLDERVARIMDIGCAAGKLTTQLKRRFPAAEVWGTDISAPMVRYAHYRAVKQDIDVHFRQMACENLDDLPAGSFDLVTAYILFHEVPFPVTERTIENVFRLLRPGGTFVFFDFATRGNPGLSYSGVLQAIDSADNSEPYAPEFVTGNVERKVVDSGFTIRFTDPEKMAVMGRVCDKPG